MRPHVTLVSGKASTLETMRVIDNCDSAKLRCKFVEKEGSVNNCQSTRSS